MPIIRRYRRPRTSRAMKKNAERRSQFSHGQDREAAQSVKGAYNDRRSRRRNAVRQDAQVISRQADDNFADSGNGGERTNKCDPDTGARFRFLDHWWVLRGVWSHPAGASASRASTSLT